MESVKSSEKFTKTLVREDKDKPNEGSPGIIRVSNKSKLKVMLQQACTLLLEGSEITILGKEETISKAVTLAELIKRKFIDDMDAV